MIKKKQKKIAAEYNAQGWKLLDNYGEDFFNQLPIGSESWSEERIKQYTKSYNESYWTEEELNNKKSKGKRNLIFKKRYYN